MADEPRNDESKPTADEPATPTDTRLLPGGARGAHAAVGMSAMDHDQVPSEALPPRVEAFGDSPKSE